MRMRRRAAAVAVVVVSVFILTGCTVARSEIVEGSAVAVAWDKPFTSYNGNTAFGDARINDNIIYATNSQFNYYDNTPALQRDTSFGTYELMSDDPLVVKYTIADGVKWSDGSAVDAADLLLNWVALSGAENTPKFDPSEFTDPATGEFTPDFPSNVVYFDSGADQTTGPGLVSEVPEVSDDKKSITMTWDAPFVGWERAFPSAGLPAHVVATHALGIEDPEKATDALVAAIIDNDTKSMAKIAQFWNTGFNFTEMPGDASLVVGNGPYTITSLVANQFITLTANENYVGDHKPEIAEITVIFISDPLAAAQALHTGEVQIVSPTPTAGVSKVLAALDMTVVNGYESTYEHIDLQFDQSKSGHFNDPLIREAFMKTVPRQEIVDKLIGPIQEGATTRDSLVFLPGEKGYDDSIAANGSAGYADVDIAGATALLAEAGVANPEVCVLFAPANPLRANEFLLLQQSAALAGFAVTDCSSPDWVDLLGTSGAYDAALFGWQSTGLGLTDGRSSTFMSTGRNNLSYYSNPQVDTLTDQLSTEFDRDKQIVIEKKIDKHLWDDSYGATIFQYPAVSAFDPSKVENVSLAPLSPTIFWNIWEWSPVSG